MSISGIIKYMYKLYLNLKMSQIYVKQLTFHESIIFSRSYAKNIEII